MDKVRIIINFKTGVVSIVEVLPNEWKIVAQMMFLEDENQFTVVDVSIKDEHRSKGYGSMLIFALMGLAKVESKVIVLFSLVDAVPFYVGCGFIPIICFGREKYKGRSLEIANLNPEKPFRNQIGKGDLIWFPPNINEAFIYL